MGFSRQEYWSGLPFPSPGALPNPGIKPKSPALQADSLPSESPGKPSKKLKRTFKKSEIQQTNKEENKRTSLAQQVKDGKSPQIKELT